MAKAPKDLPAKGERCKLRGKMEWCGTVRSINPINNWVRVDWDDKGPTVCHLYELAKVEVSDVLG